MTAPEALQAWQFRESWAVSQAGLQIYLGIHGSLRDVASEAFSALRRGCAGRDAELSGFSWEHWGRDTRGIFVSPLRWRRQKGWRASPPLFSYSLVAISGVTLDMNVHMFRTMTKVVSGLKMDKLRPGGIGIQE